MFYALFGFFVLKIDLILLTLSRLARISEEKQSQKTFLWWNIKFFSQMRKPHINTLTNHPLKYFSSSVLLLRIKDASLPTHFNFLPLFWYTTKEKKILFFFIILQSICINFSIFKLLLLFMLIWITLNSFRKWFSSSVTKKDYKLLSRNLKKWEVHNKDYSISTGNRSRFCKMVEKELGSLSFLKRSTRQI